jgi:hypothetical protein
MWISDQELSLEGVGIAAGPARTRRRGVRARGALGWVRDRLATTPGRLVLISALVVVGAVCYGVVVTGAEQSRQRAVRAARTDTEPLLVHAVTLYTALSDANATVATGLLGVEGVEPTSSQLRYANDLKQATSALTALTRGAGTAAAQASLATIADQLPIYTGEIEAARANSRQGFPIGAAYLRQADALLKSSMLPAADRVYTVEAERLNNDYQTGTDSAAVVALVAASALALVLLALAQRYVTRISRRILNILMLTATVLLTVVSVWAAVGVTSEQNSLASAQRNGSDSLEALSAADVLASRAQRDLSLTLVNRGTDQIDPLDFTAVTNVLTTSPIAADLSRRFVSYRAAADRIQQLERQGELEPAIRQLPAVATVSQQLIDQLDREITAANTRFMHAADDAASALSGLGLAIPLITVLVAVLSLLGLRQRINEYR